MGDWRRGGVLGSLRKRVAWEVKEHRRTNIALKTARAPSRMRILQVLLSNRGFFELLGLYVLLLILLIVIEIIVACAFPSFIPSWTNATNIGSLLKDTTSYLLGAQVTMIGLLFPIAVGLVTLMVQREDASSTNSDVQVYYNQTLAYQIGASGIALSVVLAAQLVWPAHFAAHRFGFGSSTQGFKIILTAVHILWFVINAAALWHFLVTSLSFVQPAERATLRRRFAANVAIPTDLSDRLALALYMGASTSLLQQAERNGDGDEPSLLFGPDLGEWGDVEVADPKLVGKVLYDVWTAPLGWILRRWWRRSAAHGPRSHTLSPKASLVFPADLRRPLSEGGVICRRQKGVPLSAMERLVVRHSFRFRKATP